MADKKKSETARDVDYADKTPSRIWLEEPSESNPYISDAMYCHGYPVKELADKSSFAEVIYLAFKGELPAPPQKQIFEALLIAFIFPGPRHPAARAACAAGVGKTHVENILPISLSVLAGERNGAREVDHCMRLLVRARRKSVEEIIESYEELPGFGAIYNSPDIRALRTLQQLSVFEAAGDCCQQVLQLCDALASKNEGVLMAGVFAAIMVDLGFKPAQAVALFQLANAPGLAAHGLDLASRPLDAVPFIADEEYYFE